MCNLPDFSFKWVIIDVKNYKWLHNKNLCRLFFEISWNNRNLRSPNHHIIVYHAVSIGFSTDYYLNNMKMKLLNLWWRMIRQQ